MITLQNNNTQKRIEKGNLENQERQETEKPETEKTETEKERNLDIEDQDLDLKKKINKEGVEIKALLGNFLLVPLLILDMEGKVIDTETNIHLIEITIR